MSLASTCSLQNSYTPSDALKGEADIALLHTEVYRKETPKNARLSVQINVEKRWLHVSSRTELRWHFMLV